MGSGTLRPMARWWTSASAEDHVRIGTLDQGGRVPARPAETRAGVGEVHDQRRGVGPTGGPQRTVVALGRGRVDVERQYPVAQVGGDAC